MTEAVALDLKDLFSRVKQFYFGVSDKTLSAASVDVGETAEYIALFKKAESSWFSAEHHELPADADVMLKKACVLIREALIDKNYRMAGDLSAMGLHLVGVYLFPAIGRKRFFEQYLLPLREKHEICFFEEEEQMFLSAPNSRLLLRPSFDTKRKDGHYYEEDTDEALRVAHPVYYYTIAVLGMVLFLSCLVGYGLVMSALGLAGGWEIVGYLGAALCGISLFSLVASFVRQYMGHRLTLGLFLGGGVLIALSVLLL